MFLPAAGAVMAILSFPMQSLVVDAVDEVRRAAAGIALFHAGAHTAHTRFSLSHETLFNLAVKNIAQPATMLGVSLALGLDGPMLKMVMLGGVLPTATEVPALSIVHGAYVKTAAATTMVSTIFAMVSISVGFSSLGV